MTSALQGEGGLGKADEVRESSKGSCVKMRTRGEGRGGQKIRKFCGFHKWKAPNIAFLIKFSQETNVLFQ